MVRSEEGTLTVDPFRQRLSAYGGGRQLEWIPWGVDTNQLLIEEFLQGIGDGQIGGRDADRGPVQAEADGIRRWSPAGVDPMGCRHEPAADRGVLAGHWRWSDTVYYGDRRAGCDVGGTRSARIGREWAACNDVAHPRGG